MTKTNRFTSAPMGIMAKAMADLKSAEAEVPAMPPTEAAVQKGQSGGPTRFLEETVPSKLPIVGQMSLDPKRVRIRPGFERAPGEYADKEFESLKESIREANGNTDPIDVRLLTGVPGLDAEVMAGTRRVMASRELGLSVLANVRECDDFQADMIHEQENRHRKNKSPYSQAIQYKSMMDSGRYKTQNQLSAAIKTRAPEISESLGLLEKAPKGMWNKVSDPHVLKTTQTRALMLAYDRKPFADAVAAASKLTVAELMVMASQSFRAPAKPVADKDETRLARRGKDFIVKLPVGLSEELAKGAADAAKKYLEGKGK